MGPRNFTGGRNLGAGQNLERGAEARDFEFSHKSTGFFLGREISTLGEQFSGLEISTLAEIFSGLEISTLAEIFSGTRYFNLGGKILSLSVGKPEQLLTCVQLQSLSRNSHEHSRTLPPVRLLQTLQEFAERTGSVKFQRDAL